MQERTDQELLREYAGQDSEPAFAALVTRHVNLVYSAAVRKTGNPHTAEEITQAVFIILARKANSLRQGTALAGWLYQTTRLTAANFLRGEIRRGRREQEAYMQSLLNEAEVWPHMEPLLEDAMGRLNEKERSAIVLRFFEGKSFQEIGTSVGGSENAAKKRVIHGLEKLRTFFSKRGVCSTTAIIAGMISANSVQAAPVALAKSVTAVAVVKGSIAAASTLTLVKGTMKIMTWIKLKTAAAIGAAVILATGTAIVASKVIAQSSDSSSAIDDSAWAQIDTRSLNALPPAFILRPTHFASTGEGFGGGMAKAGNKILGRAISFESLMSMAYGVDVVQVVPPPEKVEGGFDLLMTTADASREKLQKEIQRQLGYVAHHEARQVDVLLLTLKQAGAPGLKSTQGQGNGGGFSSSSSSSARMGAQSRSITSQNQPISNFVKNLQFYFDKPVIDRTGLTGNFDVSLTVKTRNGGSESDAIMQALPVQLGLELVPSHESKEMLTVEKVKK